MKEWGAGRLGLAPLQVWAEGSVPLDRNLEPGGQTPWLFLNLSHGTCPYGLILSKINA